MTDITVIELEPEDVLPIRHQVLRPHQAIEDCVFSGDDAPDTLHVGAQVADKLVAVASLFRDPLPVDPHDSDWRIRGMATLPEFRSLGNGARLLEVCVEHAAEQKGRVIWCNARVGATDFYARHGFEIHGDPFELPGIGIHYLMIRKL